MTTKRDMNLRKNLDGTNFLDDCKIASVMADFHPTKIQ